MIKTNFKIFVNVILIGLFLSGCTSMGKKGTKGSKGTGKGNKTQPATAAPAPASGSSSSAGVIDLTKSLPNEDEENPVDEIQAAGDSEDFEKKNEETSSNGVRLVGAGIPEKYTSNHRTNS